VAFQAVEGFDQIKRAMALWEKKFRQGGEVIYTWPAGDII
jgi:hypothetical protein